MKFCFTIVSNFTYCRYNKIFKLKHRFFDFDPDEDESKYEGCCGYDAVDDVDEGGGGGVELGGDEYDDEAVEELVGEGVDAEDEGARGAVLADDVVDDSGGASEVVGEEDADEAVDELDPVAGSGVRPEEHESEEGEGPEGVGGGEQVFDADAPDDAVVGEPRHGRDHVGGHGDGGELDVDRTRGVDLEAERLVDLLGRQRHRHVHRHPRERLQQREDLEYREAQPSLPLHQLFVIILI